ncbi:hypothetical protein ACFYOT_26395 [Saccharothrix saharensis]|uniref:hypothetical protein n=1 Tax=Saccharothrix saharensis TaxID=571190 RepID=UPI0036C3E086
MNLADVMDELGTALEAIEGLRVHPYYADRIAPPSAVVGWPDPLDYDATMGRGADRVTLPVYVLVGKVDARSARDRLAVYLDGSDSKSVKAALDNGTYTACDSVTVTSATVESISVAGVEYLGGVFQVDIFGSGE